MEGRSESKEMVSLRPQFINERGTMEEGFAPPVWLEDMDRYLTYYEALQAYFFENVRNREVVQDFLSTTFIRGIRGMSTVPRDNELDLLMKTAHNLVINHFKQY